MTRIAFWNVRHLGSGTDDDRKNAIKTVFEGINADYILFAEITTTSEYPPAQNLTYRRENPYQLCYGCLDSLYNHYSLEEIVPQVTNEYQMAGFKGGNNFNKLADRAVGKIGDAMETVGGVHVYVIHAPSSNNARKVMSFLGCYFNSIYGNTPWLIIGDFNVEPSKLKTAQVGIQLSDLILATYEYTYLGKKKNKLYDYVLCNFVSSAKIARIRCSPRLHGSDHYPIYVDF